MICEICNKEYSTARSLAVHVSRTHKISSEDYYNSYLNFHKSNRFCLTCGEKTSFKGLSVGYSEYCSLECLGKSDEVKNKRKKTTLKNYGVDNPSKSNVVKKLKEKTCQENYGVSSPSKNSEIKLKIKKTNISRYGGSSPISSKEIREKGEQTCIRKYGHENVSQSAEIQNKKKETTLKNYGVEFPSQSEIVQIKTKNTFLENYGVSHPSKDAEVRAKQMATHLANHGVEYPLSSKEIRGKRDKTCMEKYGTLNPSELPEIQVKTKETNLLKYGVEHPAQSPVIKSKAVQTNITKYGVEHPMQDPDIFKERSKKCFKRKTYIFPSGKKVSIQGYEYEALNVLLKEYSEQDIIIDVSKMPKFEYFYKNKYHRYYPDIYVPKNNLVIEVKSDYTFIADLSKNLLKESSVVESNTNFEFFVFKKKHGKLIRLSKTEIRNIK